MEEFNKSGGSSELLAELKDKRPKKALSSYMIFVQENRSLISTTNPSLTALEVMKEVGQRWQNLSEAEKLIYNDKSIKDKKRYKRELFQFEKDIQTFSTSSPKKKGKSGSTARKKKSSKKITKVEKIPLESKETLSVVENPPSAPMSTRNKEKQVAAQKLQKKPSKNSRTPRGKKNEKEKKGPRRPLSAYIFFSQEVRSIIFWLLVYVMLLNSWVKDAFLTLPAIFKPSYPTSVNYRVSVNFREWLTLYRLILGNHSS